MDGLERILWP